jgi:hypothetical protein
MPLEGFETTISVFKREKTFHALDGAATVTGSFYIYIYIIEYSVSLSVLRRHSRTLFLFLTHSEKKLKYIKITLSSIVFIRLRGRLPKESRVEIKLAKSQQL